MRSAAAPSGAAVFFSTGLRPALASAAWTRNGREPGSLLPAMLRRLIEQPQEFMAGLILGADERCPINSDCTQIDRGSSFSRDTDRFRRRESSRLRIGTGRNRDGAVEFRRSPDFVCRAVLDSSGEPSAGSKTAAACAEGSSSVRNGRLSDANPHSGCQKACKCRHSTAAMPD